MFARSLAALAVVFGLLSTATAQDIALDNTNNGAASLSSTNGFVTLGDPLRHLSVIFETPTGTEVRLTELRLGLMLISGTDPFTLEAELTAVDESNSDIPDGPILASMTKSFNGSGDDTVTSTPSYFTFDLSTSGFASFDLTAGTKYALLISQPTSSDNVRWVQPTSNSAYTESNGFNFVRMWFTNDDGAVWQSSTSHSAMQMKFTPVPEPATLGLLGAAGLGAVTWWRRRK